MGDAKSDLPKGEVMVGKLTARCMAVFVAASLAFLGLSGACLATRAYGAEGGPTNSFVAAPFATQELAAELLASASHTGEGSVILSCGQERGEQVAVSQGDEVSIDAQPAEGFYLAQLRYSLDGGDTYILSCI